MLDKPQTFQKGPLHGQAALRQRRNVFSYENIGELPAHKYGAGGGSGLGKT